jgi:hypothetical protein
MLEILQTWISPPQQIVGFEDVKYALRHSSQIVLINTLSNLEQGTLIYGTLPYDKEESIINQWLEKRQTHIHMILYGKHSTDDSAVKKQKQLVALGFTKVFVYVGGLFEWLLLQDIYGTTEFPTTTPCKDILKYRPPPMFSNIPLLTL